MKANIYVSPKKTVLDPQGATIRAALVALDFGGVKSVRQGKYFQIQLSSDLTPAQAREQVERIAKEVLTNPVIEDFTFQIEE